jgi:Ornithine/acetylornithine aminotransferase
MPVLDTVHAQDLIELEEGFGAHNYHPLDVVIERAEGVWVYDVDGKRYLDCLASYSAVNQGHCHPAILETLIEQARKVTLTSRAFRNDQLPLLCRDLHKLTGFDMALPMNFGRGSRRDSGQGRTQVGLQGERHRGREGGDHCLRQ